MGDKTIDSIWQLYAGSLWTDKSKHDEAFAELAGTYDGGLERVLYAGRCALGKIKFQGARAEPYFPVAKEVRRHFAQALVLQRENGTLEATRKDWELMRSAAGHPDKTYALMLAEAGCALSGPDAGEPNALALFIRDVGVSEDTYAKRKGYPVMLGGPAKAEEVAHFLSHLSDEEQLALINHRNRSGYSVLHEAAANPNTGIMSLLQELGADMYPVVRGRRLAHMAVLQGNIPVVLELLAIAPELFQASPACPVTPAEMGMTQLEEASLRIPRPVTGLRGLDMGAMRLVQKVARGSKLSEAEEILFERALHASTEVEDELRRQTKIARIEDAVNIAASAVGLGVPFPERSEGLATAAKTGLKPVPPRMN